MQIYRILVFEGVSDEDRLRVQSILEGRGVEVRRIEIRVIGKGTYVAKLVSSLKRVLENYGDVYVRPQVITTKSGEEVRYLVLRRPYFD